MGNLIVPFHLDEHLEPFPVTVPDGLVVKGPRPAAAAWDAYTPLYTSVAQLVFGTENAVLWSGDCCFTLAAVAGLQRRGEDPAVVWIDAHADFNTPQTSPSGYLGGMALATLTQRGEVDMPMTIGLRAVPDQRVVLAGVRDVDPGEQELLDESEVTRVPLAELDGTDLPSGAVLLHVDLDVVDPAELPGLRFPTPGGASVAELAAAVERVAAGNRLVAVHVAAPIDPATHDRQRTDAVAQAVLEGLRRGGFQP